MDTIINEKKLYELRVVEQARRLSHIIPAGELAEFEEPDCLIPSAKVAIEVSDLLPEKRPGDLFSGPQLAAFQSEVITLAERRYYELGGEAADVLAYFRNDWKQRRDPRSMSEAFARFVIRNYPQDTETLQELDVDEWVEGFSVVRISRGRGSWISGGSNDVDYLTYESLAARIAAKNQRLVDYRRRLPGWQIWLLFATHMPVLWTVSLPRDAENWRFEFGFDKVLLSSWEDGVIELQQS
jgi:hypothetical protein